MDKALKQGVVQYNPITKKRQRIKPEGRELAIKHVQSDPFFHIENSTTVKGMYDLYVQECQEKSIEPLHVLQYRAVFREHNPGSFLKQKKASCDLCDRYYKATDEEKEILHAQYQEHISKYKRCKNLIKWRASNERKKERRRQARLLLIQAQQDQQSKQTDHS
jgi:hypothetical protein